MTPTAASEVLAHHYVLASIGSVGDAYDNAMAESFGTASQTELLRDRVWRTRTQLEPAIVEYAAWFNNDRLRETQPGSLSEAAVRLALLVLWAAVSGPARRRCPAFWNGGSGAAHAARVVQGFLSGRGDGAQSGAGGEKAPRE